MNIKQRILRYTLQPVTCPAIALLAFFICSGIIFAMLCLLSWLGLVFAPLEQHWQLLLIISPILLLGLTLDRKQWLRFPFLIQQYLMEHKLAQDIREKVWRSSDAIIIGQRVIHLNRFHKQQQLLLQLNEHAAPQWFNVDLNHVFRTVPFIDVHVRMSNALLGQQVLVYYLMRSRWIVQLYAYGEENFQHLQHYIASPIRGRIIFERIPSRLMLDLPSVQHIQAIREEGSRHFMLKLSTVYGEKYQVSSKTAHFDKLELALANTIDFLRYRNFKHHPEIRQAVISRDHPFRYRNLLHYGLILVLLLIAASSANGLLALLSLVLIGVQVTHMQRQQQSPYIEESQ